MERKGAEGAEAALRRQVREVSPEINSLAHATIGAAIAVHRDLGPGFLETIYEQALILELEARSIPFQTQVLLPVLFRQRIIGEYRADLVIGNQLLVELKSVEQLRPIHRAQVIAYLKATGIELGLLINFNVPVLTDGVRRVVWTL